jgi:glycerophosphoryl diester phosphodiesterase
LEFESTILTFRLLRTTVFGPNNTTSKWLAGLRSEDFPGNTTGEQLAYAARSIKAGILSPAAVVASTNPAFPGYIPFATKEMIEQAHKLGVAVKPWTVSYEESCSFVHIVECKQVNRLNIAEQLLDWGVDGIITDYPTQVRRMVEQRGGNVFPAFSKSLVMSCLKNHVQTV